MSTKVLEWMMGWDEMGWDARVGQPGTGPCEVQLSNGNNGIVVRLMVSLGALSLSSQRLPTCYPVPTSKILGTIVTARWFWDEKGQPVIDGGNGMTRDKRKQSCLRAGSPAYIVEGENGTGEDFLRFNMSLSITSK